MTRWWRSPATWPSIRTRWRSRSDLRPDVEQLREERQVQGGAQEPDPRRAARPALVADDPLHGLHVAKAPELEALLDVHELLAELVGLPVALRGVVDRLEDRDQIRAPAVRLREVSLDQISRHRVVATRQV